MAKNTIGQFVAALRKARGMTQQEVADRLNVSNKAVSRWERDECAPDLSVIPALAEMFGVTCDELLKGERIWEAAPQEKREPKVDKQVKTLINRSVSGFKTLILLSIAIAFVGLVCMFGISYGFYRPVIGFAIMLIFEVCAFALAVLAVSKMRDLKVYNELFEMADQVLVEKFNRTLGTMSFVAFFSILAVLLLSLPLVLVNSASPILKQVLSPESYFTNFLGYIALLLIFVYLKYKKPYIAWITRGELPVKAVEPGEKVKRNMSNGQILLCAAAGLLFVFAPYLETKHSGKFSFYDVAILLALACMVANIIIYVVYLVKNKDLRRELTIPGLRNIFVILPTFLLTHVHTVSWGYFGEMVVGSVGEGAVQNEQYERYDNWHPEFVWYTIGAVLAFFLIFGIIDMLMKRKATKGQ